VPAALSINSVAAFVSKPPIFQRRFDNRRHAPVQGADARFTSSRGAEKPVKSFLVLPIQHRAQRTRSMNNQDRLGKLLDSLGMEFITVQAGSTQGQFPILDLLGNIRDETAEKPEFAELHGLCAEAWEQMVRIVESSQPFGQKDVQWLNSLLGRLQKLVPTPASASARDAEAARPTYPPANPAPADSPVSRPEGSVAGEEMALNLNIGNDGDLLREFINESREHLDNIEQGVLVLENSPRDAEMLHMVFRAFHTFKGSAGFLNLTPINRLAHVLESLLDLARQDKLAINRPVIELILRGRDVLKRFIDEIEMQTNGRKAVAPILIPTEALKAEVRSMIEGASAESSGSPAAASPDQAPPVAAGEPLCPAGAGNPPAENRQVAAERSARQSGGSAMVKVDTGKLDSLLDLVGEMVIAQSLVVQNVNQLAGISPQFARNMAQLGRITRDLQRVGMSLRMVLIRGAFQKMARVTRDLSAKQQKKVQLVTSGEDTELDRSVVEELNDPLLHMIRNSIDHGIELPDKRVTAGKPPVGTLQLRAYHQSGNIVVEIEDDGAGLNRERILAKAVERGLVAPGDTPSDEEVFGFIFAPGFSTAEIVTDVSGRGVGLDVVRRNIEKLRGRVDISSRPGQGTLFKITLPLTLAIIDGLIVKVGEERFIVPTLSVRESFRPTAGMISRIHGRAEAVNVRGRLIPLLRLYEYLGLKPASTNAGDGIVVVAQSGASLRCLLVDALLHKQEVVIKNFNEMMVHKNLAFAGAAILGDGRVGLILDVNTLVHLEKQSFSKAA
jgi:two-component system chemotaxis sensor kinase CheA